LESGFGNVLDITAFSKLLLTIGARYDMVSARLHNYPGLNTTGNVLAVTNPTPLVKGYQNAGSLTSASLSYKVTPNIVPYVTYATPRSVVPGSTGGLSTAQINTQMLTLSKLQESGVKTDFFKGKLTAAFANYTQQRTAFNQALNNNAGGIQQTKSFGNEISVTWIPTRNLSLNANMNWIKEITSPLAPTGVYTPIPVQTTGLDAVQFAGGRYQVVNTSDSRYEYRAAPQRQFNMFADYIFGNTGFDVSGGISYTSGYWASNIRDIYLPSATMFSMDVGYRSKKWEVRVSGANLTDVLSFYPTSGGAAVIPNPTRTITSKFTYKF
jgi:iron complex outermembrane receptor protein